MALAFGPGRENPFPKIRVACSTAAVAVFCLLINGDLRAAEDRSVDAAATPSIPMVTLAIDTMVVKASALTDAVAPSAGGIVTRIIFDQESGGRDLARDLTRSAGLQVRRYGGTGFAAVPALRGASAAQIRFYLDGMPLNNAQTGQVDLSLLPVERLEAAEIHRGVVPIGWGGMGGAGAINLVTRGRSEGTEVSAFAGAFGDRGGRVSWGAATASGRSSILLMAHGRQAENNFSFTDHNQTFHLAGDDTVRHRANADYRQWGCWGTGRHETGRLKLQLTSGFFRKDGGRPGPLNAPALEAAVRHQRLNGQARLTWAEHLSLEVAGARDRQFLYDPRDEIPDGYGQTISSRSDDLTGRISWTGSLVTHGQKSLLNSLVLVAGLEERRQWYAQVYGEAPDPLRSRNSTSAFAGLTADLAQGRFQLMPAWRWQRNVDDFPPLPPLPWLPEELGVRHEQEDISPSLGTLWEIEPELLYLEAHASRSVRVPTWIELFGHRGGIAGNRELLPERIEAADLGLTLQGESGATFIRAVAFQAEADQTIVFVQNSPGSSKAQNIGRTRTRGLEWEAGWERWLGLGWKGNLTWQLARDRSGQEPYQDNHLPYLSDLTGWLRASLIQQSWESWAEWFYESSKFRDRANTQLNRAPGRHLVNLGFSSALNRGEGQTGTRISVTAEVFNLFNDDTYDVEEFPLPGRSWQLSVRLVN